MIAVSYLMKRKIKKIFLEVISKTKFFNIKIQWNCQRPRFCQTYRGTSQRRRTGQRRIQYGDYKAVYIKI